MKNHTSLVKKYKKQIRTIVHGGETDPAKILFILLSQYQNENRFKPIVTCLKSYLSGKTFIDLDEKCLETIENHLTQKIFLRDAFFYLLFAYFHYFKDCYAYHSLSTGYNYPALNKLILLPLEQYETANRSQLLKNLLEEKLQDDQWSTAATHILLLEMTKKAMLTEDDLAMLAKLVDQIPTWGDKDHVKFRMLVIAIKSIKDKLTNNLFDGLTIKHLISIAKQTTVGDIKYFVYSLLISDIFPVEIRNEHFTILLHELQNNENCPGHLQSAAMLALVGTTPPPALIPAFIHTLSNNGQVYGSNGSIYHINLGLGIGVLAALKIPESFKPLLFDVINMRSKKRDLHRRDECGIIKNLLDCTTLFSSSELRQLADNLLQYNEWHGSWTNDTLQAVVKLCHHSENQDWLYHRLIGAENIAEVTDLDRIKHICRSLKYIETLADTDKAEVLAFLLDQLDTPAVRKHAYLALTNPAIITLNGIPNVMKQVYARLDNVGRSTKQIMMYLLGQLAKRAQQSPFKSEDIINRIKNLDLIILDNHSQVAVLFELLNQMTPANQLSVEILDLVLLYASYIRVDTFVSLIGKMETYDNEHRKMILERYYIYLVESDKYSIYSEEQHDYLAQSVADFDILYQLIPAIPSPPEVNYDYSKILLRHLDKNINFSLLFSRMQVNGKDAAALIMQLIDKMNAVVDNKVINASLGVIEGLFPSLDFVQKNSILIELESAAIQGHPSFLVLANQLYNQYVISEKMDVEIDRACEPKMPAEVWDRIATFTC